MKGKKKQKAPQADALGVTYGNAAAAPAVPKPKEEPPPSGSREAIDYATRGDNNKSVIMAAGQYWHDKTRKLDPLFWLLGKEGYRKMHKFLGDTAPEWTNKQLAPVVKLARKADPMSYIAKEGSGIDEAGDWVENKPGDVIGAGIGAYFGGAAAGLWGAGSGASGGAGANIFGSSGTPSSFGSAGINWSNPQMYASMAQNMPQGAQQDPQAKLQMQLAEMQRKRKEREEQERAMRLAEAMQDQARLV